MSDRFPLSADQIVDLLAEAVSVLLVESGKAHIPPTSMLSPQWRLAKAVGVVPSCLRFPPDEPDPAAATQAPRAPERAEDRRRVGPDRGFWFVPQAETAPSADRAEDASAPFACVRARPTATETDRIEVDIRPLTVSAGHEGGSAILSFDEAQRLVEALEGAMEVERLRRRLAANHRALERALYTRNWR